MKYKIKVHTIWEFGQRKDSNGNPHQEDSLFPAHGQTSDSDRLFILCDGMGGHDKGEVASSTVCEVMGNSVLKNTSDPEGSFSDIILQKALENAFEALDAKDTGAEKKMGTTMTFLKLHSGGYTAAHIGDSRIYHFRPGPDRDSTEIIFKSEDHSLVNDLLKIGAIAPEDVKTHPQRNVITRAMQPHDDRQPRADVHHSSDIRKGDFFYLCSDGMLEQAEDNNLRFIFSDKMPGIETKVDALIKNSMFNHDNHTAFVIEIVDVEGNPEKIEPCPMSACPLLVDKDTQASTMPKPIEGIIEATATPTMAAAPMNAPRIQQPPMPKKRGNNTVLIYILSGLLVVLVALVAYFLLGHKNNPPKETAEDDDIRIERHEKKRVAEEPAPSASDVNPTVSRKTITVVHEKDVAAPAKNASPKPTKTERPAKKTESTPNPTPTPTQTGGGDHQNITIPSERGGANNSLGDQ